MKEAAGWRATRVSRSDGPSLLVLQRSIGPLRLAYIPYGWSNDTQSISTVAAQLRSIAHTAEPKPHLLRWDIPWEEDVFDTVEARSQGLRPAAMRVQPPDTVILSILPSEEELLQGMKPKTRYNIRLAERKGVTVTRVPWRTTDDTERERTLKAWYQLYEETARRDQITIHTRSYYRQILDLAAEPASVANDNTADAATEAAPVVDMYLATHEDDLLSGIITASYGGTTTYLYGAAGAVKRNLMASYLLQWRALQDARNRGDREYDFFGIPPADDPHHPMHGLYRFKVGFGGRIIHRPGPWDLTVHPLVGRMFRLAERGRRWYYFDMKKRTSSG